MSEDVELPHRPKVWGVNFSPTGPARCNPIDVERFAGEMERHLSAALTENKGLRNELAAKEAKIALIQAGVPRMQKNALAYLDRAESAESSLRAISEALKEKLPKWSGPDAIEVYDAICTDALHARLRAIVEGK